MQGYQTPDLRRYWPRYTEYCPLPDFRFLISSFLLNQLSRSFFVLEPITHFDHPTLLKAFVFLFPSRPSLETFFHLGLQSPDARIYCCRQRLHRLKQQWRVLHYFVALIFRDFLAMRFGHRILDHFDPSLSALCTFALRAVSVVPSSRNANIGLSRCLGHKLPLQLLGAWLWRERQQEGAALLRVSA